MNVLKYIIIALIFFLNTFNGVAQKSNQVNSTSKTEVFKVLGNCESCKFRIEKAAKIEGVFKAEWNPNTKMMTLVFDPSKVKIDEVQKKIAAVGHDTEKYKSDNNTYKKLPACCQYVRK